MRRGMGKEIERCSADGVRSGDGLLYQAEQAGGGAVSVCVGDWRFGMWW